VLVTLWSLLYISHKPSTERALVLKDVICGKQEFGVAAH